MSGRRLRIVHLPANIGAQAGGLARAERGHGADSECVVFEEAYFAYPADRVLFRPGDSLIRQELKRWRFLFQTLRRADVVHFHFGQKFLPFGVRPWKRGDRGLRAALRFAYAVYAFLVGRVDLWLLRAAGIKMFATFNGDDIRQGDYCRAHHRVSHAFAVGEDYYDGPSDRRKRKLIRLLAKYCEKLYYVNPDLAPLLPAGAEFIGYTGVDPADWRPVVASANEVPLIVHAPTHRAVKGTPAVLAAVEELRRRGHRFEFRLIEGMSRNDARKLYERADVLVDQLLVGWFGILAVELMCLGKPVICYLRRDDFKYMPAEFVAQAPVVGAGESDLVDVLENFLCRPQEWAERGRRSREFAARWYDPHVIARKMVDDYSRAVRAR